MKKKNETSRADVGYIEASKFTTNPANRTVNKKTSIKQVKKLKAIYLNEGGFLSDIIVNTTTGNIIDGQHRVEAFTKLYEDGSIKEDSTIGVKYVTKTIEEENHLLRSLNNNSKTWTIDDYVESETTMGNKSCSQLKDWCLNHKLTTSKTGKPCYKYGAAIITGKDSIRNVKSGTFSITDGEFKEAENVHKEITKMAKALGLNENGPWIVQMACAWHDTRKRCPFDQCIGVIRKKKNTNMYHNPHNRQDFNIIFSDVESTINRSIKDGKQ